MTRPTAAVVVCAYTTRRWDDLRAALTAASTQQPEELWLVVDHDEELLARAEAELTAELATLRVLPSTRRRGLSGARNAALEQVRADVVVFLDDDATPEPGWLAALCSPYVDSAVVAVGGVAQPRWPAAGRPVTLPSAGPEGDWSVRGELDWVVGCSYAGQPQQKTPVRNLMGCTMSFRREVFTELGGFCEDLGRVGTVPLGCEETELCIRATTHLPGVSVVLEPRARVRHHVSADRLTWSYLRRRGYAEGVSKAAVAAMVGSGPALATERGYVTRVLPAGLRRELASAVRGHAGRGPAGAAAIVLALASTATGYVRGRLNLRRVRPDPPRLSMAAADASRAVTG